MCGIAGILNFDGAPARPELLRRMCGLLAHRGPDDEAVVVDGPAGLGHRRLAIIDLSAAAAQPIASEDGTTWVTYNGEIYNFRDLRAEYASRGHVFRSQGDTEVLLHAYAEEGPECVRRFNGMFAFGLWDRRARQLLLARDRFGVKPLYYRIEPDRLIFASEIKAILPVMNGARRVSCEALNEYFTFQNILSDLTLFDGIRILPAGHLMVVRDDAITIRPYWDLVFSPEPAADAVLAARLVDTFEAAVRRQLVSDVPVGSHLSGGIDTASLVAVASRQIERLATFTVGFDSSNGDRERPIDERSDAELVARTFGTKHHEVIVGADDMLAILPELVWHLEDLRTGMCYQHFAIARLASRFVRVVLAGVGGDEMFGGYPWRYGAVAGCHSDDQFEERYYRMWCRLIGDDERCRFFTPGVSRQLDVLETREKFRAVLRPAKGWHPVDKAMYFDVKAFLHGLLIVEDRMAMAHGLEARVPFLDHELITLAASIPPDRKVAGGMGKVILRRALSGRLPEAILGKAKRGFAPPEDHWYWGKALGQIAALLLGPSSHSREYIEPGIVRHVVEDHVSGRTNRLLLLWSLLCFEWWCRVFLDGDGRRPERPDR